METPPVPEKAERVISIDCNSCGAQMAYNADKESLLCDHCGNTQELPKESDIVVERDFTEALDLDAYGDGFWR